MPILSSFVIGAALPNSKGVNKMDKKCYLLVATIADEKDAYVLCRDGQFRFRWGWKYTGGIQAPRIYKTYTGASKMFDMLRPMTSRGGKPISFSIQET